MVSQNVFEVTNSPPPWAPQSSPLPMFLFLQQPGLLHAGSASTRQLPQESTEQTKLASKYPLLPAPTTGFRDCSHERYRKP